MTDTTEDAKDFYVQKGYVRHTLIVQPAHKEKLKKLAKHYGITQGEVVEILLDQIDLARMSTHFEAKRKSKNVGKTTKTELVKKMGNLTQEQMAAIEAIIAKTPA